MIWYLIINFSHGGALAIPEPSLAQCRAAIQQLNKDKSFFSDLSLDMFCVPGMQSGVLQ